MLSRALWVDISEIPGDLNYILGTETISNKINSFIPLSSIQIAADKRKIERRFKMYEVDRPTTFVVSSPAEIAGILKEYDSKRWILKYPTGCGGMNHRIIRDIAEIPDRWPQPFLIQEFIESERPAVYRVYGVNGDLFGFNARKFASPEIANPWVSHANGASYVYDETPDRQAIEVAKSALIATGLYHSFGVVDLVRDIHDKWYALEVGTDGIYNHVDRDIDNNDLLDELNERLAIAFWSKVGAPLWGKSWKYRD